MAKTEDLTVYATKEPTEHQKFLAEWLRDKTGAKIDTRTVAITLMLLNKFQASPENKKANAERKAARQAELKSKADKVATVKAPVKKSTAAKKAAPAPVKKSTTAAPAKKATAKKATTVKKAATNPADAPF